MEHPAVAESAVVSSPDPIRGEVVKAFIVLNADYKSHDQERLKKEIQEHVKRTTAPYKYPRKVSILIMMPICFIGSGDFQLFLFPILMNILLKHATHSMFQN